MLFYKRMLLILGLLCFSCFGHAQTAKGTWLLGGGAGFNAVGEGGAFTPTWYVLPGLGYFISENLAMRANLRLANLGEGVEFSAGPAARYYFYGVGNQAKLFLDAGAGFGTEVISLNVTAGFAYFFNPNTALEMGLGFTRDVQNQFSVIGFNIGFQIHLKSK